MTDSYLSEPALAPAPAAHWKEAADLDCEDDNLAAFAEAVIHPEAVVKLATEHTIVDHDVIAGGDGSGNADITDITLCAFGENGARHRLQLPAGDVGALSVLLVNAMRAAAAAAEEATSVDLTATIDCYRRERDDLVKLVLQWQNRKDGDPRPDAADIEILQLIADEQENQKRLAAFEGCTLGEAMDKMIDQKNADTKPLPEAPGPCRA